MRVEIWMNGRLSHIKTFVNTSERVMFVTKFNTRARAKNINYRAVMA